MKGELQTSTYLWLQSFEILLLVNFASYRVARFWFWLKKYDLGGRKYTDANVQGKSFPNVS